MHDENGTIIKKKLKRKREAPMRGLENVNSCSLLGGHLPAWTTLE